MCDLTNPHLEVDNGSPSSEFQERENAAMTMTEARPPEANWPTVAGGERRRVYAIAFDMDTSALKEHYGGASWRAAYRDIRDFLAGYGFTWKQGSLQFSSDDVTPVVVVLAAQEMAKRFSWFGPSVRDIRMLRIEEDNDLLPAVASVAPVAPHPPSEIIDLFSFLDEQD